MINRAQSGRSMMEMLMMLAMIGVLSMITFFGYEMAMAKYRANSIIKETNQMAFEIEQQFENEAPVLDLSEYQPDDCDWCDEAAEGEHNIRLAGYDVTVTEDEATTAFLVSFMDVDQKVCEKLINTGWSDPYAIFVNDHPVPSALAVCGANNQIDVAFNNTLDTNAPDCNPGYGWNEENQRCEACPAGQHNNNNVCEECPQDTYQEGNECIPCPSGAVAEPGATDCLCPMGYYRDKPNNLCPPCTQTNATEKCQDLKCENQSHCGGSGSQLFCDNASTDSHVVSYGYCKLSSTIDLANPGYSSQGDSYSVSNGVGTALLGSASAAQAILNGRFVVSKPINPASAVSWCESLGYVAATRSDVDCGGIAYANDAICTNAPTVHALFAAYNTGFVFNEHSSSPNLWVYLYKQGLLTSIYSGRSGYVSGFSIRALCRVP